MKKNDLEKLAQLMSNYRKVDPREHLASAILTDKQWEIFYKLQQALRPNYGLFAGASLTAFFDPTDKVLTKNFPKEVREVSVLFAITSKEVEGVPRLFVVDEERVSAVLKSLRAPYLFWNEPCDSSTFATNILKKLDQVEHDWLPAQRNVVNKPEFYAGRLLIMNRLVNNQYESLQRHKNINPEDLEEIKRKTPKMLREVALRRLAPKLRFMIDSELEWTLNRANVDILVHSVDPNTPILGIEIDGKTHLTPDGRAKDRKKERIFEALRLPLMRVLPSDVTKCLPSEWLSKKE